MGKMTKGFMIAAVVMILFGLLLCVGGAAAGGVSLANSTVRSALKDKDYHITVDKEGIQIKSEKDDSNSIYQGMNETLFSSQDVNSLKIEIKKAEVEIMENDSGEEFSVYTDGGKFDVDVKHGVLSVKSDSNLNENKVYIKIPTGFEFDEADISAGAASVNIDRLLAGEVDVEIGAGVVEIEELSAREADFEIGAGQISVNDSNLEECSVSVGMGEFYYGGTVSKELDVECSMGVADIRLNGREEDYNYEIECSAGNVTIDDESYSGLGTEKVINNRARADIEIECSMGDVTVEFNGDSYDMQNYNGQHHEEQHHNE